jgi:glucose-1-phosphate thymidylyltransferase
MGYKIGCIEEIALNKKWISKSNIKKIVNKYSNSDYGKYLNSLIK